MEPGACDGFGLRRACPRGSTCVSGSSNSQLGTACNSGHRQNSHIDWRQETVGKRRLAAAFPEDMVFPAWSFLSLNFHILSLSCISEQSLFQIIFKPFFKEQDLVSGFLFLIGCFSDYNSNVCVYSIKRHVERSCVKGPCKPIVFGLVYIFSHLSHKKIQKTCRVLLLFKGDRCLVGEHRMSGASFIYAVLTCC